MRFEDYVIRMYLVWYGIGSHTGFFLRSSISSGFSLLGFFCLGGGREGERKRGVKLGNKQEGRGGEGRGNVVSLELLKNRIAGSWEDLILTIASGLCIGRKQRPPAYR